MPSKLAQFNGKQYEKLRVLGKGSFGTAIVYKRTCDSKLFVFKEIDLNRFKCGRERVSALQEAKIMSKLSHQNIIKYFNAYTTNLKLIIEMEYASMGTLQSYLGTFLDNRLLSETETLCIFKQIVSGLEYLHSNKIIHLDLKMANIFVTRDGLVKIGDFGFAQFLLQQTRKSGGANQKTSPPAGSQLGGTLAYSSPERCLGEQTDFKADIWSLGCILYELLVSRPLFEAATAPELVLKITSISFEPIRRSDVSAALRVHLFESLIAREPARRPSAAELASKLARLQDNSLGAETIVDLSTTATPRNRLPAQSGEQQVEFRLSLPPLPPPQLATCNKVQMPHSQVYQVRLDASHIILDRVQLPQTKRVRQIVKGRSHYLMLTYDNIVYGWGRLSCGQLGACSHLTKFRVEPVGRRPATSFGAQSSLSADLKPQQEEPDARPEVAAAERVPPLSLSTQTLGAVASQHKQILGPATVCAQQKRQAIFSALSSGSPSGKPFILQELTNRKIVQVCAGNDFSMFLTKTGLLMTCGSNAAGCLGRGESLGAKCFTPCLVDSLLNFDIVSIACGPKHAVAVCANGRAFAWGKLTRGRLGIEGLDEEAEGAHSAPTAKRNVVGKFVVRPMQVSFSRNGAGERNGRDDDGQVRIKQVFCGDRCTVFIDSNNCCWACGENRFNKLGLDVRRRFKKTLVVEQSWLPSEISALKSGHKQKVVSVQVGHNHSTYLTSDAKLIVLGRDVNCSHKFRQKVEQTRGGLAQQKPNGRGAAPRTLSGGMSSLVESMLTTNKLANFKYCPAGRRRRPLQVPEVGSEQPKLRSSFLQRQLVEGYLRKSRSIRRMPFESCVVAAGCSSKFTLALTNDNRIYFWGTRKHSKGQFARQAASLAIEPKLIARHLLDEEFVKVGKPNSSLLSNIELLGSDQPIIHSQDPKLTANSLDDLWILDCNLTSSTSSSCSSGSSTFSCSAQSRSSSTSCSCTSSSFCCANSDCSRSSCSSFERSSLFFGADSILEPQPIVSLYVPAMLCNQNTSAMQFANLFCLDEDRFYIVLDTTIKPQAASASMQPHSGGRGPTASAHTGASSRRLATSQPKLASSTGAATRQLASESNNTLSNNQEGANCKSKRASQADLTAQTEASRNCIDCSARRDLHCSNQTEENKSPLHSPASSASSKSSAAQQSPTTCLNNDFSCLSLDEPRSFSTFAAAIGGHFVLAPTSNSAVLQGQALSFGQSSECTFATGHSSPQNDSSRSPEFGGGGGSGGPTSSASRSTSSTTTTAAARPRAAPKAAAAAVAALRRRGANLKRKSRLAANRSESTTATGEDCELSSPPDWVRDEFHKQQQRRRHDERAEMFALDSSSSSEADDEVATCNRSEVTLIDQTLVEQKGRAPTTGSASSQVLSGTSGVRATLIANEPLAVCSLDFRPELRANLRRTTSCETLPSGSQVPQATRAKRRAQSESTRPVRANSRAEPVRCKNLLDCDVYRAPVEQHSSDGSVPSNLARSASGDSSNNLNSDGSTRQSFFGSENDCESPFENDRLALCRKQSRAAARVLGLVQSSTSKLNCSRSVERSSLSASKTNNSQATQFVDVSQLSRSTGQLTGATGRLVGRRREAPKGRGASSSLAGSCLSIRKSLAKLFC